MWFWLAAKLLYQSDSRFQGDLKRFLLSVNILRRVCLLSSSTGNRTDKNRMAKNANSLGRYFHLHHYSGVHFYVSQKQAFFSLRNGVLKDQNYRVGCDCVADLIFR